MMVSSPPASMGEPVLMILMHGLHNRPLLPYVQLAAYTSYNLGKVKALGGGGMGGGMGAMPPPPPAY